MTQGFRTAGLATLAILGLIGGDARGGIVLGGGFGPNGDIGFVTSPAGFSPTFGAATGQGSIYQMDGFVNVPGVDLGAGPGSSADLANGAPAGLGFRFDATQPTAAQLLLTYTFTNNTGSALSGLQFLQYTDADIGPNFADESATVNGASNLGQGPSPASFQVGDPSLSSIFTNLLAGTLDNANDFPNANQSGDVSVGLGFQVGTIGVGQAVAFQVLLSDDGSSLGNFSITQDDPVFTGDSLTISGAVVPEPASLALLALGLASGLGIARARRQAWTRSQ